MTELADFTQLLLPLRKKYPTDCESEYLTLDLSNSRLKQGTDTLNYCPYGSDFAQIIE